MKNYTGPWRIAHRGVGQAAPENTLEAFCAAAEQDLEGIEIDVRLTRDGRVAIAHDATMQRLTTGAPDGVCTALVNTLDAAAFTALRLPYANHLLDNWHPEGFRDECKAIDQNRQLGLDPAHPYAAALAADPRTTRPILLEELFSWMVQTKRDRLIVEIECKSAGLAEACSALLAAFPYRENCILFSGEAPYIAELQRYHKQYGFPEGVKLGANIRMLNEEWKSNIPEMALYEVGLNDLYLDRASVDWLRAHDIRIFSNLGDYPAAWANVCALGIDGFKTNYSAAFTEWWKAQNACT